MPQPRFIVCWVQPPRHTHTRKRRGLEGGSRDCSNAAQQCNVFATGGGVAFRLKICGDFSVSVSASVPNSVVCEPVHRLCGGCTSGVGEVVADAVHGAHSVFRPPMGGGMHTAHFFVRRKHHSQTSTTQAPNARILLSRIVEQRSIVNSNRRHSVRNRAPTTCTLVEGQQFECIVCHEGLLLPDHEQLPS